MPCKGCEQCDRGATSRGPLSAAFDAIQSTRMSQKAGAPLKAYASICLLGHWKRWNSVTVHNKRVGKAIDFFDSAPLNGIGLNTSFATIRIRLRGKGVGGWGGSYVENEKQKEDISCTIQEEADFQDCIL